MPPVSPVKEVQPDSADRNSPEAKDASLVAAAGAACIKEEDSHQADVGASAHNPPTPVPLCAAEEEAPTPDPAPADAMLLLPTDAADRNSQSDDPDGALSETLVEGMTVATSASKRQHFRSLQVDVEQDARTSVPFPIAQETFAVPSACFDDALVDGAKPLWVPGQPLRIAYVSWNMAGNEPFVPDVAAFCVRPNAHLVVVATQENGEYLGSSKVKKEWAQNLEKECLRGDYTVVSQTRMWALHLMVFARSRDVAKYVAHVHSSTVKTATRGMSGNKGGVAIGLTLSMSPLVRTAYEVVTSTTASALPNPLEMHAEATIHDSRLPLHADVTVSVPTATTSATSHGVAQATVVTPTHPVEVDDAASECERAGSPSHLSFLFINAHLAAHQNAVDARNKGYARIVAHLKVGTRGKYAKTFKYLRQSTARRRVLRRTLVHERGSDMSATESESRPRTAQRRPGGPAEEVSVYHLPPEWRAHASSTMEKTDTSALRARDVTDAFDLTFFGGDLNYRLNGTKAALEKIIHEHRDIRSVLMYNDQLNIERHRGHVFAGYREGQLLFRPTYKYDVNRGSVTDTYNTGKKQRLPAYCDRVLFKKSHRSSVGKVTLRLYTDVRMVRTSDHKPVVALFDVDTQRYDWT